MRADALHLFAVAAGRRRQIRENPDLLKRWTRQSRYLIDLTKQLEQIIAGPRTWATMLTAQHLRDAGAQKPESGVVRANYDDFLATYDYVADVMPYMEQAKDPQGWLDQLVKAVREAARCTPCSNCSRMTGTPESRCRPARCSPATAAQRAR